MIDELGDRMKAYENDKISFVNGKNPVYMRLDGRSFSNFTRKLSSGGLLERPRDKVFEDVFVHATMDTVKEFNFSLGFHQSDEISLFFPILDNDLSQLPFDGKIMKLCSVVSSYFTSSFMKWFVYFYDDHCDTISFDARICELPNEAEATNMLVWRYKDAKRNLITDIAHHQFGHKKLQNVSSKEKYEMIGSPELKPGNFIKRVSYMKEDSIRHRVDKIDVDFDALSFEERKNLIYGEMHNE